MPRPVFITEEDLTRWLDKIEQDPYLPKSLASSTIIKEVCCAGLWLCEELDKLECPRTLIDRIQFTAGRLSFGRDPWEAHQHMLELYKTNQLKFEEDITEMN